MSSQPPPQPNVDEFNQNYWRQGGSVLTTAELDTRYLRFPAAQGGETLQDVIVIGSASFTNPTPPSSLQNLLPVGTNDSSIPTTEWVQTVVSGGGGNETLADTLLLGNSAGATTIDMNENDITTVNDTVSKAFVLRDATSGVNTTSRLIQSGVSMVLKNEIVAGEIGFTSLRSDAVSDTSILTNMSETIFSSQDVAGTASNTTLRVNRSEVIHGTGVDLNMNSNDITGLTQTTYTDTTIQSSAYTGAGALAGSYTASNITLDTDGKISAIGNGTGGGTTPSYTTTYSQDSTNMNDLNVTMPTGISYISLTAISTGGEAGTNTDVGGDYNSGGSGGGGQMATNTTLYVNAGDIIGFQYLFPTDQTQLVYTPISTGTPQLLAQLFNGLNGGNASGGAVGIAGLASPVNAYVNTNFGLWSVNYGLDGAAGALTTGGAFPNIAVGGIDGTGFTDSGDLGCGQLFKNSGGANEPATSTSYVKGGFITYHF